MPVMRETWRLPKKASKGGPVDDTFLASVNRHAGTDC